MKNIFRGTFLAVAVILALALLPGLSGPARADSGYDPYNPDWAGKPIQSSDGNYLYVHFYTDEHDKVVSPNVDIVEYIGSDTVVTVPATLDTYPVECILMTAFSGSKVSDVTISEGIEYLGLDPFSNCPIESISFPSTMNTFETNFFLDMPSLSSIVVAPGNPYMSSLDGVLYNKNADQLLNYPAGKADASFTVPGTVTQIADAAFYKAKSLTSVTLPGSVTTLGDEGSGLDAGGSEIFSGCKNLASITVDGSSTTFSSQDGVLYNQDKSVLIKYPQAKADKEFTIPDGVETIGVDAFSGVASIETLHIPACVANFVATGYFDTVENPFNCCPKLSAITVDKDNGSFAVVDNVLFSQDLATLICYPAGRAENGSTGHYPIAAVKAAAQQKIKTLQNQIQALHQSLGKVPDKVIEDMSRAIREDSKKPLKPEGTSSAGLIADTKGNYPVPDGTARIAAWAFGGTTLSMATIPDSVQDIAWSAFDNAAGISICGNSTSYAHEFATENGLPFIAEDPSTDLSYDVDHDGNAIITGYDGDDPSVMDLTIPTEINDNGTIRPVTGIFDSAFIGMDLESIAIPDSVKTIGSQAFADCQYLTTVKIPDSVTSIGDYCFAGCSALQSVRLPKGLAGLGEGTFDECYSLQDIALPSSVVSLGSYCFEDCNFSGIDLPDGLTSIGDACFEACGSLASVTIPDGVTSLGSFTFEGCSSLKTVQLPEGLNEIGDFCFFYCTGLGGVTIPKNVSNIGELSFSFCDSLEQIDVESGNSVFYVTDGVLFDSANTALVCYPAGKVGSTYAIPSGITMIYDGAFSGNACPLTSVSVGTDVTDIGSASFISNKLKAIVVDLNNADFSNYMGDGVLYNKAVTSILCYPFGKSDSIYTIPSGVASIDRGALAGRLFVTLNIPASITSIGAESIAYCNNLLNINVNSANTKFASISGVLTDKFKKTILQFPAGRTGVYWAPSGITAIGDEAFSEINLNGVVLPATVTTLGKYAFAWNWNMLSVVAFYGNIYKCDHNSMPFDGDYNDPNYENFTVYYHISKLSSWKKFGDYPSQPFCILTLNLQDSDGSMKVVAPIALKTGKTYGTISAPSAPVRANFTFAGWYKDSSCTTLWNFAKDTVSKDVTIYAKWISAAVTGVQGTPLTYNSIQVTWTAISGVSGYEVSRSTNSSSGFKVLGTATSAAYTDKTAVTGTPYYYRVRAYVKYGSNKVYGEPSAVSASVATVLAKPLSVKAVRLSATSVKVSWGKVAGATKYEIRQYIGSPSGSYTSFYSTSSSYTDKKLTTGTHYYYVVVAYRKVGSSWVLSEASDPVTATP